MTNEACLERERGRSTRIGNKWTAVSAPWHQLNKDLEFIANRMTIDQNRPMTRMAILSAILWANDLSTRLTDYLIALTAEVEK
jgi:hypothetical protein